MNFRPRRTEVHLNISWTRRIIETGEGDMTITNYWWYIIWMFVGGGILAVAFPKQDVLVMGEKQTRWSIFAALLLAFPFILAAAGRGNIGDTAVYRKSFEEAPSTLVGISGYLETVTKDKGFSVLTVLIKSVFGNSDVIYFFIIAAIQIVIVALIFRKFSEDYWLSMFIFIASTDYFSWVQNGVRQFVAVALIFGAFELMLKKKYIAVILIILLASTMHGSALLMIPIVFIIQGQAWNRKTLLCIVASILVLFFVNQFTNMLEVLLSDTQYTNVVSDWRSWNDDGTHPIRVLVYAVPTILSLIGLRYIKEENDPVINMCVNAGIISTGLGIISMGTSGVFLGRLPIYVSLYSTGILLPWELNHMFTKESARIIKLIAVIMYIIFFYYQMHFTWGLF